MSCLHKFHFLPAWDGQKLPSEAHLRLAARDPTICKATTHKTQDNCGLRQGRVRKDKTVSLQENNGTTFGIIEQQQQKKPLSFQKHQIRKLLMIFPILLFSCNVFFVCLCYNCMICESVVPLHENFLIPHFHSH